MAPIKVTDSRKIIRRKSNSATSATYKKTIVSKLETLIRTDFIRIPKFILLGHKFNRVFHCVFIHHIPPHYTVQTCHSHRGFVVRVEINVSYQKQPKSLFEEFDPLSLS